MHMQKLPTALAVMILALPQVSGAAVANDGVRVTSQDKTFSVVFPVKPKEGYEAKTARMEYYDRSTKQEWVVIRLPYHGRINATSKRESLEKIIGYEVDPDRGEKLLRKVGTRLQTHRCLKYSIQKPGDYLVHRMTFVTRAYTYELRVSGTVKGNRAEAAEKFFSSFRLYGEEAKPSAPSSRLWSYRTGKLKIEADLIGVKDGVATLRKKDGVVNIPVSRLAKADTGLLAKLTTRAKPPVGTREREWVLGAMHSWPDLFEANNEAVVFPLGTVIEERHRKLIFTKYSGYINHDFDFDVLVSLVGDPSAVCKIGMGDGKAGSSLVLMLGTPAPSFHKGLVQLANNVGGGDKLGNVQAAGTHLLRLRKRGVRLQVVVDVNNDGPGDGDIQQTVTNVPTVAANINAKNAKLFFGGAGVFHSVRLNLAPPKISFPDAVAGKTDQPSTGGKPAKKPGSRPAKTTSGRTRTTSGSGREKPLRPSKWLAVFQPTGDIIPTADGVKMRNRIRGLVVSKQAGYLGRDFVYEVVLTIPSNPAGVVNIGIGDGKSESTALIMMGNPSPSFHKGLVQVGNNIRGGEKLGYAEHKGKRRLRIEKVGDRITFSLDITMDGQSDDDISKTIDNVRKFAPKLSPRNSYLFFGGSAIFHQATIRAQDKD